MTQTEQNANQAYNNLFILEPLEMKMILNQKVADGTIENEKRKNFFQDGQLETTFNSINRSDPNKELIVEESQHKNSRNHLAFDFFEDSDENHSEGEIRKDSILYDENYSPKKSFKIKPSPMKLRQRKQTNKNLKKSKKIKKAKKRSKDITSKSLQFEALVNSDEKASNPAQQAESRDEAQNKNIKNKKISTYGVQTINSVGDQESKESNNFFILKIQEKTPQMISMEIRKKLMESYQELLNEKMQNDREYHKKFKILIKQNTRLLRQNQYYKAKLQSTEHPVKIETNLTEDQSIRLIEQIKPVPIEMEYRAQTNQLKKLQTSQIKQFFIEKPIKPIKIQQNYQKQKQFQTQLSQIIPAQTRQQSIIGHLSSFGSSKDSAQDNDQNKNKFLPNYQEYMVLKLKETEKYILKDTKKKFNQQDFDYWLRERNQQRRFMSDKNVEPERQTIFNRRRRNQKLGSSNSSSASERSQNKNIKVLIQPKQWQKKWNEKFSISQNKRKAKRHRHLTPNFQTKDTRLNKKEAKLARKLERGNSRFSKEDKSSKNNKWSKNNEKSQRSPRFSSDEKQIDY